MKGKAKAEKKIEKIVENLIGFDVAIKLSDSWQAIPEKKKIFLCPYVDETAEIQENIWADWIKENYNFEGNIFMISLLHEIGHILTYEDFKNSRPIEFNYSEDLSAECDRISINLCEHGLIKSKEFENNCLNYFNAPVERIATDWAVHFYRTNKNYVNNAFDKICKMLVKFYKKNGIEEAS